MSLLNDALRKKERDAKRAEDLAVQGPPKASYSERKRRFLMLLLLCVAGTVAVMWCWDLFSPPGVVLNMPPVASSTMVDAPSGDMPAPQPPSDTHLQEKKISVPEQPPKAKASQQKDKPEKPDPQVQAKVQAKTSKTKNKVRQIRASSHSNKSKRKAGFGPEAAFYKKALAYHRRGDLPKAIQMYREVLRKDPHYENALLNLSSAYLESDAYTEAHMILQKLYVSDPKNAKILLNLAIAQIGLGKLQKALLYLNQASGQNEGLDFEICFHKGIVFSRLEDFVKAEESYKEAQLLCPDSSRLMFNMAVLYDRQKRYDDAVKYYRAFMQSGGRVDASEKRKIEERIGAIQAYVAVKYEKTYR